MRKVLVTTLLVAATVGSQAQVKTNRTGIPSIPYLSPR